MYQLNGILATAEQTMNFPMPDGSGTIYFTFHYHPTTQNWYMDLTFNTHIINGIKLRRDLNALYQWRKILPFGINIDIISGYEPMFIDDFSSGRVLFNILTSDEVAQVTQFYMDNKI